MDLFDALPSHHQVLRVTDKDSKSLKLTSSRLMDTESLTIADGELPSRGQLQTTDLNRCQMQTGDTESLSTVDCD